MPTIGYNRRESDSRFADWWLGLGELIMYLPSSIALIDLLNLGHGHLLHLLGVLFIAVLGVLHMNVLLISHVVLIWHLDALKVWRVVVHQRILIQTSVWVLELHVLRWQIWRVWIKMQLWYPRIPLAIRYFIGHVIARVALTRLYLMLLGIYL